MALWKEQWYYTKNLHWKKYKTMVRTIYGTIP